MALDVKFKGCQNPQLRSPFFNQFFKNKKFFLFFFFNHEQRRQTATWSPRSGLGSWGEATEAEISSAGALTAEAIRA